MAAVVTGPLGLPTVEQCERNLLRALQTFDVGGVRDALYQMAVQDPDRTRRHLDRIQTRLGAPTAFDAVEALGALVAAGFRR